MRVPYTTAFSIYTEIALSRPLRDWRPGAFASEAAPILKAVGWSLAELERTSQRNLKARWCLNIRMR